MTTTGPATREIDDIVLLLGVADVQLALYGRGALATDAGVSTEGDGSHRIVIRGDAEPFTDPDGFTWERTA